MIALQKQIVFATLVMLIESGLLKVLMLNFSTAPPPVSNPNEYTDYMVNFMKILMNKNFPIILKTITQRRLLLPWITTGIMEYIRKKHRWFRLLRNGLLSYNVYKIYVKKLRLLLRTAREQYFVRRLTSLNTDMKRNLKVLNSLMGKSKKFPPKRVHY